jgi:DNA helicase HerA-like ATPase
MKAILGVDSRNKAVSWEPDRLINPHVIITGMSGAGKTHFLRSFINQIVASSTHRFRTHLIDIHGDIEIPGAHTLDFTSQMPYGFNPLVIDPNPHAGGVNAAITRFLKLLSKTANYKIGDRQEAVMRALLTEIYEKKGFFVDNTTSWRLDDGYSRNRPKTFPTVSDAYRFSKSKFEQMFFGGNSQTLACVREVARKQKSLLRAAGQSNDKSKSVLDNNDFVKALESLQDAYTEYFANIHKGNGQEFIDVIRYPNKDMLAGVVDRLEKLHFMGVFSGDSPPFNPNTPVWRYKLNMLDRDASVLFAHTLSESIFRNAVRNGESKHIRDIIVLDEAKRFQDDSPDSIFNIIGNEGRKFGVALFSSSQSHSHFTSDAIQSSATSIILRQDESNFAKVKNLTNVDLDDLKTLAGRQTALIKMNVNSGTSSGYEKVIVNSQKVAQVLGISERQLSPSTAESRISSAAVADPYASSNQYQPSRLEQGVGSHQESADFHSHRAHNGTQSARASQQASPTQAVSAGFEMDIPDVDDIAPIAPGHVSNGGNDNRDVEAENLIDMIFNEDDGGTNTAPAQQQANNSLNGITPGLDVFNLNPATPQRPQPAKPVDVMQKLQQSAGQTATQSSTQTEADKQVSRPVNKRNLLL